MMPPLSLDILTDPQSLARFKDWVSNLAGLSHDALHLHIGLLLWLVLFVILGRKKWSGLMAWTIVLSLSLWVEWMDFRSLPHTDNVRHIQLAEDAGAHDVINTMIWPSLLVLLGPWMFQKLGGIRASDERGYEPFE